MRISQHTIAALGKVITGDEMRDGSPPVAPYRSGPNLVAFFNQFRDERDSYGQGFPSRWAYAEDCIHAHLGLPSLVSVIEGALDPRHFLQANANLEGAVEFLNRFLDFDGFILVRSGRRYRVGPRGAAVDLDVDQVTVIDGLLDEAFLREQLEKCDGKIADGDFDGAITNARSLLESALTAIERELSSTPPAYDGDLTKLYKRVQKKLNLEPSRSDIEQPLKQLLGGLSSIVHGLAALRNRMSDAHARTYRPAEHHARLAVNAAKTVIDFLVGTMKYQREQGLLDSAKGWSD